MKTSISFSPPLFCGVVHGSAQTRKLGLVSYLAFLVECVGFSSMLLSKTASEASFPMSFCFSQLQCLVSAVETKWHDETVQKRAIVDAFLNQVDLLSEIN